MRDALGGVQSVLVLGGGSDIALATVRKLVADRCRTVVLAGRDPRPLESAADRVAGGRRDDGRHRGVRRARPGVPRAGDRRRLRPITATSTSCSWRSACSATRPASTTHPTEAAEAVSANYVGAVSSGLAVANRLRGQGHGVLVVITSVAGERARKDNFVYGSSKAGLDAFAQGLGDSLVGHRRPGHGRPTRLRPHEDDRGQGSGTVLDDRRRRRRRGGRRVCAGIGRSCGHRRCCDYVFSAMRHLPRPLWRKVSASR